MKHRHTLAVTAFALAAVAAGAAMAQDKGADKGGRRGVTASPGRSERLRGRSGTCAGTSKVTRQCVAARRHLHE
jgi:uncharacterized membrane protein